MAKNIERIVIIDHDNHAVIFEDIDVDELQKKYDGEEEDYINSKYDLENYSWDYIVHDDVSYITDRKFEPIVINLDAIKDLAKETGKLQKIKNYWLVKISEGEFAGTLIVHCKEETPEEVIELMQDIYPNTKDIMTVEVPDEETVSRFEADEAINEM